MDDLEELLSTLPELAENAQLTIGDASTIKHEITRLQQIEKKLITIYDRLEIAINDEKFNKGFIGILPTIGSVASVFVPGGFLVQTALSAGSGFLAEKLFVPEQEETLADWLATVKELIDWCQIIQEWANEILQNNECIAYLKQKSKHPGIVEQVGKIDKSLRIHLEFGEKRALKKQIESIKSAQSQLQQIQPELDSIIHNFERGLGFIERIKALIDYCGKAGFIIKWIDEENGLIISYDNQIITRETILEKCEDLKEKTDILVVQANKLRSQAEQSIHQGKEETQQSLNQTLLAQNNTVFLLKPSLFFLTIIAAILSVVSWKMGDKFPQLQQQSKTNTSPIETVEASLITTQPAVASVNTQTQDTANFEKSQKLAMEAAVMVQNAPHPLEVWQQAVNKWQEAINLLEAIPESSSIAVQAQDKLASYRTNYTAINNRLLTEQKAAKNLEEAQKLAWEAAVLVQNPPHPEEVWQAAQSKLQQSISLLQGVPQGTFVKSQAEEKMENYKNNYAAITKQLEAVQSTP